MISCSSGPYTNHVASKGGGGSQGNVHVCLRRGEGGFDKSPRSFFGPNFSIVVGKFRVFFLKRTKKFVTTCFENRTKKTF